MVRVRVRVSGFGFYWVFSGESMYDRRARACVHAYMAGMTRTCMEEGRHDAGTQKDVYALYNVVVTAFLYFFIRNVSVDGAQQHVPF